MSNYNVDTLENKIIVEAQEALKQLDQIIGSVNKAKESLESMKNATGLKAIDKEAKQATSSLTKMQLISKNLKKVLNFSGLIYGAKKAYGFMQDSAKNSIDYVETLNLFEVSMGKTLDAYGNIDKVSSQYYTKALDFQQRLNEAFGTNIEETMRYQALYNQMTKSMGVGDNASYVISENLTKLGIDLASLFNKEESATMEALRAGVLAGQTKPLRNYGLDVTQNSLKPLLGSLGIDRSISDLSQAEKMVLRYIAVLKQASAAHGDFAKTIESPANQIKVLKSQFEELKTAIGNLFQGLLGQVLPYVNAVIMVIKELVKMIGSLFGFTVSSSNSNLADITGVEELDTGLSSAAGSAKALKAQLMGFDEINNITTETNSGGGGGSISPTGIDKRLLDALGEYDNLMDKVRMKALDIRDKIMDWLGFTKVINPLTGEISWKLREGWTNLKKIWTLIKGLIGLGIAVKLIKLIGNLTKLWSILKTTTTSTSAFATGWKAISSVFKNLRTSMDGAITYFKYYKSLGASTGAAFSEASKQGLGLLNTTTKLVGGIGGLAISLYGAYDCMRDFSEGTKTAGTAFTQLGISVGGAAASGALLGSVIPGVGTAIGAVTGATLGLITAYIGYESEEEKVAKLSKQHTEERHKLIDAFEQQKRLVEEDLTQRLTEIEYTDKLVKELDNLVDGNGKVKEGYEDRVSYILNEVNQAYGTELKLIDGQIQGYKEFKESISDVIAAKKAEIVMNANEALYAEALKQEKKLIKAKEDAQNDLNKAHEMYDRIIRGNTDRMSELMEQISHTTDTSKVRTLSAEWNRLNQQTELYKGKLAGYQEEYDEASQALIDNMKQTISYSNLQTAIISGNSDEIEKACQEMMKAFDEQTNNNEASWKNQLENAQIYGDLYIQTLQEAGHTITEKDKELSEQRLRITIDDMKNQIKTVNDLTPEVIEAFKYLAEGNRDAYNRAIEGLPEDVRKKIAETTTAITTELGSANPKVETKAIEVRNTIKNTLGQNFELSPLVTLKPTVSIVTTGASSAIKTFNNAVTASLENRSEAINKLSGMNRTQFHAFAEGGFPSMGEIFMAREAGPELVGRIGRRTAVANNGQIVEAVSKGVYDAVSAAMPGGSTVSLDIRTDEGIIVKKAVKGIKEFVTQTGELPFPVPV